MFTIKRLSFTPLNLHDKDWSQRQEWWISKEWKKRDLDCLVFASEKRQAKRFLFTTFFLLRKLKQLEDDEINKFIGNDKIEVHLREGVNRVFSQDGLRIILRSKWSIEL
jgi:hypothetical protein